MKRPGRHEDVDTVAAVRELHRIAALLAAALRLATTPDLHRPDDRAPCPACNDMTETTETGD